MQKHYNVLFLCTGNSARSILAEAILTHKGKPTFTAYSAGSHATGVVRPEALRVLEIAKISTAGLRSKNWTEFAQPGAPKMDFVFTVCDNAASETCPVWPGQPISAHWGISDPAQVRGAAEEIEHAFYESFLVLQRRIDLLVSLPLASLDAVGMRTETQRIGRS